MRLAGRLFGCVCWLWSLSIQAQPQTFVEGSVGLGIQTLQDTKDSENNSVASKVLKLGVGMQLLPVVSTNLALYSWGVVQDNQREDTLQFDGISAGWEVTAHLPLSNDDLPVGPYLRYGGHCWAATIVGLATPWAKSGCSDLTAVGISFSSDSRRHGQATAYFEFSRTRFDDVTSGSLVFGIKNSF